MEVVDSFLASGFFIVQVVLFAVCEISSNVNFLQ
jgi:hypothetical protein